MWGKDCRAHRINRACGAASCNRYILLPEGRTTVRVCQTHGLAWQGLRPLPRRAVRLTTSTPSVHSSNDSGGQVEASASDWQTGNSGVNPGRPRRCIRAILAPGKLGFEGEGGRIRAIAASETPTWWARCCEKACDLARARKSEDLPGVVSLPICEGGMVGTAASAAGRHGRFGGPYL